MVSELWTPEGVAGHTVTPAGHNAETGGVVQQHVFKVHDPVTGKRHKFCILIDDDTSQAHLEDMISSAVDRWLVEVRQKEHKPAPTPDQRKEIGSILNDIRKNRMKRAESSTGLVHFPGIGIVKNGRHRRTNNGTRPFRGSKGKNK